MKILSQKGRLWGGLLILLLGSLLILASAVAQGPDYDVSFERVVESEVDPSSLRFALDHVDQWPHWFFSMADARVVDRNGNPLSMRDQDPLPGAKIRMSYDPKKGEHKKFDLYVRIVEYHPGQSVRMDLELDSSGRITQLFSKLEWTIELLTHASDAGTRTTIRGTENASTRHWRSRLFSRVARRIVMNQLFYPDLITLGRITRLHDPAGFSVIDH